MKFPGSAGLTVHALGNSQTIHVLQFSRKFQIGVTCVFPFYITKKELIHLTTSLTPELLSKLFPAMTQETFFDSFWSKLYYPAG